MKLLLLIRSAPIVLKNIKNMELKFLKENINMLLNKKIDFKKIKNPWVIILDSDEILEPV